MLRYLALAAVLCYPVLGDADSPTIDEAVNRLYDFDFQATHRILNGYIAAHPDEPLPYAFRASAYLFFELDRMGILESEFLTDDERIASKRKHLDPDPAVRERFRRAVDDAETRAQKVLRSDPENRNALFAMCIAQGVSTDYMALIEKRQFSSLTPAKRSNSYAQSLLKLDPQFYDAYLTAGFSEYMVGSLPFFVRWFVRFDNVSGNKERAKQNLQLVVHQGNYFKSFAKILLGIIHLREKEPREAQKLLLELARDYPENPLFRKELLRLNQRLGISSSPAM